jgi:hypothetical protein
VNPGGDWSNDRWVRKKVEELFKQILKKPDNKADRENLYKNDLNDWPRDKYDQLVTGVIRHSDILEWDSDDKEVLNLIDKSSIKDYLDKLEEHREDPLRFSLVS